MMRRIRFTRANAVTRSAARLIFTPLLILAVTLTLSPAASVQAQTAVSARATTNKAEQDSAVKQVRAIIKEIRDANAIPGVSFAVAVGGQVVLSEGVGYADLENRIPVTPLTRMRIGSVSKSVTSIAIAQLVESGKLDLDAEVQKYVPSFPRKRWPITVRQVAGHTAGIRHYRGTENLINRNYPSVTASLAIFRDDSLLFQPGTKYSYSSYGWNLISAVIEGASGEEFIAYMRANVFQPFGLRSLIPEYTDSIITFRARFYQQGANRVMSNAPFVDNSYKWAGGGFLSNSEDLLSLANSMMRGEGLKPATVKTLFASQTLSDGTATNYGMGWYSGKDAAGRNMVWHGGASVGARAILLLYPDHGVVVAMLANAGHAPMTAANASRIAMVFIP